MSYAMAVKDGSQVDDSTSFIGPMTRSEVGADVVAITGARTAQEAEQLAMAGIVSAAALNSATEAPAAPPAATNVAAVDAAPKGTKRDRKARKLAARAAAQAAAVQDGDAVIVPKIKAKKKAKKSSTSGTTDVQPTWYHPRSPCR